MRDLRVRDLLLGTMNASKSAQLLMKAYNLEQQGKKVMVFKPETDSRDGAFVVSRALSDKRPAIVVPKDSDGSIMAEKVWTKKPDILLVDELQFFTEAQVEKLAEISITFDVDIYAYGLLLSYTGKMFDATKRAIESGFRITMIDMSCDYCQNDATHHLLYVDEKLETDGSGIVVEDEEFKKKKQSYKSVCFSCYQRALDVAEMEQIESKHKK
jgi:thymidine kinase